ncbi:MAG: tetratricopeptide repeat protein [Gammaproteobacteria bacterium]|nr:tetratricopeptide repeat protein [Gammaproteobacteria bacterium]
MINRLDPLLVAAALAALLNGCAGPGERPAPVQESEVQRRETAADEGKPAAERPGSGAVLALRQDAERQSSVGRLDRAAALLERALRIEPRNAGLWHRLARVRLQQERLHLAESLALKSNSLAGGDPALQGQNWRLIARARRAAGDVEGAGRAERRAGELSP